MPSAAFSLFNGRRRKEVLEIATVFEEVNNRRGRKTKHSLLNGALVLLVSSWEVYCEDVCIQAAGKIAKRNSLRFDQLTSKLRKDLLRYAVEESKGKQDPLTEKVALLPDDGWKQLLTDRLEEYVADFNTPKFSRQGSKKDLNGLFRCVLGTNISTAIEELLTEPGLCGRLDSIVTLRGEIAHTGGTQLEDRLNAALLKEHTATFVEAAAAIDVIVHQHFRNCFKFVPWKITSQVREVLRESVQASV